MFSMNRPTIKTDKKQSNSAKNSSQTLTNFDKLQFDKGMIAATQSITGKSILDQIREVNRLIICTDLWFETEMNSDLIESCIYQRESLSARYRHLISQAKEQNLTSEPFKTY